MSLNVKNIFSVFRGPGACFVYCQGNECYPENSRGLKTDFGSSTLRFTKGLKIYRGIWNVFILNGIARYCQ